MTLQWAGVLEGARDRLLALDSMTHCQPHTGTENTKERWAGGFLSNHLGQEDFILEPAFIQLWALRVVVTLWTLESRSEAMNPLNPTHHQSRSKALVLVEKLWIQNHSDTLDHQSRNQAMIPRRQREAVIVMFVKS